MNSKQAAKILKEEKAWESSERKREAFALGIDALESVEALKNKFIDEQMKSRMIELTKEITKKELRKTCRISTPYDAEKEMQLPKWEEFN